jgi:hypothetical protein
MKVYCALLAAITGSIVARGAEVKVAKKDLSPAVQKAVEEQSKGP